MTTREKGFTLIECSIAMVVLLVGLAGVLTLLVTCLRTEMISRDLTVANSLSRSKMEQLKNTTRTPGGSLTSDVDGYYDNPTSGLVRRWVIANEPSGAQTVTVASFPTNAGVLLPQVEIKTRMQ